MTLVRKTERPGAAEKGMTLVEILLAVAILLPLLLVGMQNFVKCTELNEKARQSSLASWGVRTRLAAIKNTAFSSIYPNYNNTTFDIAGLTGKGYTKVDNTDANLLVVTISYSWRDRMGRIIGEDKNLNGALDAGEDANGNGVLDSPVMVVTQMDNIQ